MSVKREEKLACPDCGAVKVDQFKLDMHRKECTPVSLEDSRELRSFKETVMSMVDPNAKEPEYLCTRCSDLGKIFSISKFGSDVAEICGCRRQEESATVIREMYSRVPLLVQRTDIRPDQEGLSELLGQSLWLWGASKSGKTHWAVKLMAEMIRRKPGAKWQIFIDGDLQTLWLEKYDGGLKEPATVIRPLNTFLLDDLDKLPDITKERETELQYLFNKVTPTQVMIITSNLSISEFCNTLPRESMFKKKYGKPGPIETRLNKEFGGVCREVVIGKPQRQISF